MNKKIFFGVLIITVLIVGLLILTGCGNQNEKTTNSKIENSTSEQALNNIITENRVDEVMNTVYIKINDSTLSVELEDNSATIELKERLKNGDIVVNAHEYGGFEKVGDLGFSLTREDTNITTSAGDIVLYQGNQISLFYNSNSWSYTKLGKILNVSSSELKNILGNGDVTITFTLSQ